MYIPALSLMHFEEISPLQIVVPIHYTFSTTLTPPSPFSPSTSPFSPNLAISSSCSAYTSGLESWVASLSRQTMMFGFVSK